MDLSNVKRWKSHVTNLLKEDLDQIVPQKLAKDVMKGIKSKYGL